MENPFIPQQEHVSSAKQTSRSFEDISANLRLEFSGLSPEKRKAWVEQTVRSMKNQLEMAGADYYQNVAELYEELKGSFLIRRDDPTKLMKLATERVPIEIASQMRGANPYPNSTLWSRGDAPAALAMAFTEGKAQIGGISMIAGFKKGKELSLKRLPTAEKTHQKRVDEGRAFARFASGTVLPEDLRFLIMRVPLKFFPEELLTEEEDLLFENDAEPGMRKKTRMVLRGFLLPKSMAAIQIKAA